MDLKTRTDYCQCPKGAGPRMFCAAGTIWRADPEFPEFPIKDFWVRRCPAYDAKLREGDQIQADIEDAESRHATFHETQLPMIRGEIDELKDRARGVRAWIRRAKGWPDRDGTEYGKEVGPWTA